MSTYVLHRVEVNASQSRGKFVLDNMYYLDLPTRHCVCMGCSCSLPPSLSWCNSGFWDWTTLFWDMSVVGPV